MIKRKANQKGFTLVELLVVVVIIGILASVAVPNFVGAQDKAKNSGVQSNVHSVQMALEQYGVDNGGAYGATAAGSKLSNTVFSDASYLATYPKTPWNTQQDKGTDLVMAAADLNLNIGGLINAAGTTANPVNARTQFGAVSVYVDGTAAEKYDLQGTGKKGNGAIVAAKVRNY